MVVLLVDHPLLITNEIQWHLLGTQRRGKIIIMKCYRFCLKALFSNILEPVVRHFAKSIRVTTSMVCVHMPDHLMIKLQVRNKIFKNILFQTVCSIVKICHLLLRSSKPLSDRNLAGPIIFLTMIKIIGYWMI